MQAAHAAQAAALTPHRVGSRQAMSLKYRDCGIELEPTQELYGIGFANLTSCLFNGFPVTGGFARTPLNGSAGARTPLASFVTAFLLLIVVLLLTTLFERLPQATLAATICVAVTGLLDFHTPKLLWQVRVCGVGASARGGCVCRVGMHAGD